ncbi:hypothetical protein [Streptomyces sp. NPDC050982]|uniref:hypothetical protein n=1 Tax=Streptomyces sp. NPDC050982 TaxID=3154746 RepID=UPI00340CB381
MVDQSGIGRLLEGERWRSERLGGDEQFERVTGQLQRWLRDKPFDLEYVRSLDEGGSGSYAAVVARIPHDRETHWRQLVLKLVPAKIGPEETRNFRKALLEDPNAFRSSHLVDLEEPSGALSTDDDKPWWIHLQKVALNDLTPERAPRLVDLLDGEDLHKYCGTITRSLLSEWNSGSGPEDLVPEKFLKDFLGVRLGGNEVVDFLAAERLDTERPEPTIRIPGRKTPLPNPFGLLQDGPSDLRRTVRVFCGNSHGDLHVRNVLLPRSDRGKVMASKFRLIDLGRFSDAGPLSHDPMRLLLSAASEWLTALVPHSAIRSGLAELMVAPGAHPSSPPLAGYRAVAGEIHRTAESWAAERHSAVAQWKRQNHLVLVGTALRYFAREDSRAHDRWWFLEVAALATRAFLHGDGPQPDNWITNPTEVCATDRKPLVKEAARQSDGPVAKVIPLFPPQDTRAAVELAALVQAIEHLPIGVSSERLALVVGRLRGRPTALAAALTDEETTLLRNELIDTDALLSRFHDSPQPGNVLSLVQQAGERLRRYGSRLWPSEVG